MEIVYNGEMETRPFTKILGDTIPAMCAADPAVVYLDADLSSCIKLSTFIAEHPDRGFNCGISEANMIGVACGLAAEGFKPFAHTFGPFASRRVFDQVFLSAGYAGNDITVIGTDPGVTAAFNGGTHMPFEDVALYRTIPTATVMDCTDANMLIDLLWQAKDRKGVKYIRVGRKFNAKVYADGSHFEIGKGIPLREGKDLVIFCCGIMVHEALQAANRLHEDGIEAAVVDLFTIKPLDAELVRAYANKTGRVLVAENHNRIGGLYSAVLEALALERGTVVGYVAVEDEYGEVGPQDYLQQRFGLTSEHVEQAARKLLRI